MTDRKRARTLAMEALAAGEPLAWFERLYREAQTSGAVVPWADYRPNPNLVSWLDAGASLTGGRALDIGCGFGDDAEELSRRGFDVTAFDISESAVAAAQRRFPATRVAYRTANLLELPLEWRRTFAFVLEAYTLQVLPREQRIEASRVLAGLVAPGGVLLVIARGREPADDPGAMPWPLTRAEVEAIATDGVCLVRLDDFVDAEEPPVRRFRAVFECPAG
jgi:2-polyprenyl-3-methyl-5-hydroxy-6-metoxy-1,4-benzoquinol methylase